MAESQASSSKVPPPVAATSDIGASAEQLKSLLSVSDVPDIRSLVEQHLHQNYTSREAERRTFLSSAPTYLSLHSDIQASLSALESLSSFLTTFSDDLGAVSHQISTLKQRSAHLDEELRRKREQEEPLARLLDRGLVLNPKVVEKIFDSEPDQSWKGAIRELERSIEASRRPLDQMANSRPSAARRPSSGPIPPTGRRTSTTASNGAEPTSETSQDASLAEAARIAEACKAMAASKLRSYLISPFQLMRTSVTTNLQVLQTSVLIPHHQPLYAFLARQMPRVAIDVQRAYVTAARLYFETGFRRYARSMGQVRKRGASRGGGDVGSIVDTSSSTGSSSFAALGGFLGGSSSSLDPKAAGAADPYLIDPTRLSYASLPDEDDAPPTILGYMGDDTQFSAPPEAVLRSISLVFFDNACSEFTFLVRYFEALQTVGGSRRRKVRPMGPLRTSSRTAGGQRSRSGSTTTAGDGDTTFTSSRADETIDEEDSEVDPSESASVAQGVEDELVEEDEIDHSNDPTNLVQLSKREQALLQGRGASAELFRKVFEPVVGTWLNFCRAVLHGSSTNTKAVASASTPASGGGAGGGAGQAASAALGGASTSYPPLGLMPLLISLRLIDRLLALAEERGAGAVLTGPLLQFKMEAWPLAQRRFTSEIDAVARLAGAGAASSSAGSGWFSSFGLGGSSGAAGEVKPLPDSTVVLIAGRYAALFSQVAALVSVPLSSQQRQTAAAAGPDESMDSTVTSTTVNGAGQEQQDPSSTMLSSSLVRLRTALVDVVVSQSKLAAPTSSTTAATPSSAGSRKRRLVESVVRRVREELEGTAASAGEGAKLLHKGRASSRTMREVSWWREWERGQLSGA